MEAMKEMFRDVAQTALEAELDEELDGRATEFLTAIRVDKSRYARDQFCLIHSLLDQYGIEAALQALGSASAAVYIALTPCGTTWSTRPLYPVAHSLSCLSPLSRWMTPSTM